MFTWKITVKLMCDVCHVCELLASLFSNIVTSSRVGIVFMQWSKNRFSALQGRHIAR